MNAKQETEFIKECFRTKKYPDLELIEKILANRTNYPEITNREIKWLCKVKKELIKRKKAELKPVEYINPFENRHIMAVNINYIPYSDRAGYSLSGLFSM